MSPAITWVAILLGLGQIAAIIASQTVLSARRRPPTCAARVFRLRRHLRPLGIPFTTGFGGWLYDVVGKGMPFFLIGVVNVGIMLFGLVLLFRQSRQLALARVIAAEVALILLLVLLNGFFALAEMARVSAKRARLQAAAERGSRGARIALELMEDSTAFPSAVQVGITLIGILTGVNGGATFAEHLGVELVARGVPERYAEQAAFGAVVLVITMISLIFGELVPKRVALSHSETLAIWVAPVMKVLRA